MLERSLPKGAYLDDGIWRQERERVFARTWVCIGRHDEVGAPAGSYRLVDLQGEGILVVRAPDGSLAAVANLCLRRGAELVDSSDPEVAEGRFGAAIRCRSHDSPCDVLALDVDTWGGFVFVRLDGDDGVTLVDTLGPVVARLANYPLADLVRGARTDDDVAANWKVIAENYNECYHCGPVHPELCDLVPSFRRGGGNDLDWDRGIPHRDGAYTFTRSGTTTRRPFPGLSPDELVNHKGELVYPNLFLSLSCDHVAAFTLWPSGPARTRVTCDFLFHPDEVATPGFDPSDALELWDLVNHQDWAICERVQRGMASRSFTHGLYAPMEDPSLDIRRWWTRMMGGDNG